jgi:hypothetical protein
VAKRKTLYVTTRAEWRAWLTKHYQSETEVWLIYYKKPTGRGVAGAGRASQPWHAPRPSPGPGSVPGRLAGA